MVVKISLTLIQTVTVGAGGAASITFSAIAADWTDLYLTYSLRDSGGTTSYATLGFNGSTANFTIRGLGGNGTSAVSFTSPSNFLGEVAGNGSTANTFASASLYIANYASSSPKSFSVDSVTENNATLAQSALVSGLWNQTSAVTSISLYPFSSPFLQYSSASLYGILKGSDGIVTVS